MADAAVSTVVNKLSELAREEVLLLVQVGKDVKNLGNRIEWLQTLLKDADQQRRASNSSYVTLWVKQARDAAYEVEDVLDEFSWRVERAKLYGHGWKSVLQFKWATDCFTQVRVTHKLSSRIETIKGKLEELDTNKTTYKIKLRPSSSSWAPSFSKRNFTWIDQDPDKPVGLDKKIEELTKLLVEGGNEKKVVSIIGQNGSGRSLLAKKAYNSRYVQAHFEVVVWKNLPIKFRLSDIYADIYRKVVGQGDEEEECDTEEDMGKALNDVLLKRRYLIVLNGISSIEYWKNISTFLPDENNGSRVLLIPKNDSEVTRLSATEGIIPFQQNLSFSKEQSEELFGQKFFHKLSYVREYGPNIHKIHSITKGHPLIIMLLAGLLRSKELSAWEKVFKYLGASMELYPIDRMLTLSFDDLPHQLKSCFLYFAAVPQNTGFEAKQLVRIWVAEGFIQPKSGKTLEEIGEGYLIELISRSLVRIEEKDEFGCATAVAVDDQIHTFLQSEVHESCFVETHDNADIVSPAKIRRLSIQNYTHKHVQVINSLPRLRSFLCDCSEEYSKHSKPHKMKLLLQSKYLRVVDLHGLIIKKLPGGISNMIHLRYLGVRCVGFQELPSSICKLQNLQTLDITKSSVKRITNSFWRIPTLRHILAECVKIPENIGELINLQTLQSADCTNWNPKKHRLLEKISNVRILQLEELSTSQATKISQSLSNLEFLKHLNLKVRKDNTLRSRIFAISSLRCLQSMELHGPLDNLGENDEEFSAHYNLPNLTSLTLVKSMLRQRFINLLSKLPSLTRLSLCKSYNEKNIEFLPNGFQNLDKLELIDLHKLEEWKELAANALPKLTKLILSGCTKLKGLPEGLQNLTSLEEVMIGDMETIIKEIRKKEGKEHEKVQNVKILKTRLGL